MAQTRYQGQKEDFLHQRSYSKEWSYHVNCQVRSTWETQAQDRQMALSKFEKDDRKSTNIHHNGSGKNRRSQMVWVYHNHYHHTELCDTCHGGSNGYRGFSLGQYVRKCLLGPLHSWDGAKNYR